jgi:hypothetical protein
MSAVQDPRDKSKLRLAGVLADGLMLGQPELESKRSAAR